MLIKQSRLIILWIYTAIFIAFYTVKFVLENLGDDKQANELFLQFIDCLTTSKNPSHCYVHPPGVSFTLLMFIRIIVLGLPIVVFVVFGARPSLLHFWKEYFTATIRQRRLFLEFIPSFDPSFGATVNVSSVSSSQIVESQMEPQPQAQADLEEVRLKKQKSRVARYFQKVISEM